MAGFKKSNNLELLEQQIDEKNIAVVTQEEREKKIPAEEVETVELQRNNRVEDNDNKVIDDDVDELQLLKLLLDEKSYSNDLSKKRVETISLRISTDTLEKLKVFTKDGIVSQSDIFTILIEKLYKEATNGKSNNI